jgi:hypothetical protein
MSNLCILQVSEAASDKQAVVYCSFLKQLLMSKLLNILQVPEAASGEQAVEYSAGS